MKIIGLTLLTNALFSIIVSAVDIEIIEGWQLKGIENNLSISSFNKGCIDIVWAYDEINLSWKAYSPNLDTNNLIEISSDIQVLEWMEPTDGFWVKGNSNCIIENSNYSENSSTITQSESESSSTITHNGVEYGTLISETTGRVWLDRNLGALQACIAIDDFACYGDYYQWGRESDGHESPYSQTTDIQASSITPGHNKLILKSDWVTGDLDGTLRSEKWAKKDGSSICPVEFRVPTKEEFDNELVNISTSTDSFRILRIPLTGIRSYAGDLDYRGVFGSLWTNSVSGTKSYRYTVRSSYQGTTDRMSANPIRCIKD